MRIVFMGTPEFGVPSLNALLDAGYDVAACCTQPDRPQGRRMTLTPCPVKIAAQARGVQVCSSRASAVRRGSTRCAR